MSTHPTQRRTRALLAAMTLASAAGMGAAATAYADDVTVDFATVKPTGTDVTGATKDVFTIPVVKGVTHYIAVFEGGTNGGRKIVYTPSTAKVPTGGATKVVLEPVPALGYAISAADASFDLVFDATPVPVTGIVAPTKVDPIGRSLDKIVITPVPNVMWKIGDAKPIAVTGTRPVAVAVPATAYAADNSGATVTVTPVAATIDYSVDPLVFSATTLSFGDKDEITIPEGAVTFMDAVGVTKDTANLPYVANVKWVVDGKTYTVPAPTATVPNPVLKVKADKSSVVKAVPATPANYTFAAGATTEWSAEDALTDDKGSIDMSTATAPVGTDAPGATSDKVTLTGVEGVQWRVDAVKVVKLAAGKTATVIGRTVTAEPLVPQDYDITGKKDWTEIELGFTDGAVKLNVPAASVPVGTNAPGVTKDTVTLTGVANVKWQVGTRIVSVAPGAKLTVPMRAGDTVVAVPALGYTLTGTASWSGVDLGLLDDQAPVTVVAPTADDLGGASKDVVVLTPAANVVWDVAGVKYTPTGTTPMRVSTKGKGSVVVKALPKTADFAITNDPATWTLAFSLDKATVTPTAPEVVADAHAIKLTKTSGVIWKVDGATVAMTNNVVYYVVPATKSSVTVTASLVDTVDYAFADGVTTSYPLSFS